MRIPTATFVLLTLASPLVADHGDRRAGPPRFDREVIEERLDERLDRVADLLDLTADQRAALERLREDGLATARPKLEAMRDLHDELRSLLESDAPDAGAIGTKVIAIHRLREELGASRDDFEQEMSKLLTTEQRFAFEALREARRDFEPRGARGRLPERQPLRGGHGHPEPPID